MAHVMLADAGHHTFRNQHVGSQLFGDRNCDIGDAAPIMLHCEVFKMLLDGADGDNAPSQFARLHSLPELTARKLTLHNFNHAFFALPPRFSLAILPKSPTL